VSVFRKELANFFTSVTIPATSALLAQYGLPAELLDMNYDIITQQNSAAAAAIEGLEWSWRQSFKPFSILPPSLRAFQVFANGTYLQPRGAGRDNLSGYTPRNINWGVSYARARFAAKMNIASSVGALTSPVGATATTPAGTYTAVVPRSLVAVSMEYRFYKSLSLDLSVQNLTNERYRAVTIAPGAPAYTQPSQTRDLGIEYVAGIRGTF
jgi:outer membrane receptor protein involved in Fe transport